jgi:glycosyltransferase involved in cell wall biosynthesis
VLTRFTIAIPTHDRRETVLLAARSALAQTRAPEQLLVLCDGCSDGTAEALHGLSDPRIETLELPKAAGYGYAHRNRSLELARGEAILWLSDDDLLAPDHLERIGELWDTGRFDLVQSHGVLVLPDDTLGWLGADWSLPFHRERLATFNTNPMTSVSLRVDMARAVGGWDASLPRAADWDLWQRALAAGARSALSPEPSVLHFRAVGREQAWPHGLARAVRGPVAAAGNADLPASCRRRAQRGRRAPRRGTAARARRDPGASSRQRANRPSPQRWRPHGWRTCPPGSTKVAGGICATECCL